MSLLAGWPLTHLSQDNGIRLLGAACIFGLPVAGLMWRFRHVHEAPSPPPPLPEERGVSGPWRNRAFIWYLIALTFFGTGGIIGTVAWPVLLADTTAFHFSYTQVGVLSAMASVAQMAAYLFVSRYIRVHADNRQLVLPYALFAVNIATCLVLLLLGVKGTAAFVVLLCSLAVSNFGVGLQGVYFYLVVNAMAGDGPVLPYQSAMNIVVGTRGLIMPAVAAALLRYAGLKPAAAISAGLIIMAAVLAGSWRPKTASKTPSMV